MNLDLPGFECEKAAQAAAVLTAHSKKGLSPFKLNSLLYLAERAFIQKYRHLMFYDALFSTPHGPVCWRISQGITGAFDQEVWSQYFSRQGDRLALKRSVEGADLTELIDAEFDLLDDIRHEFGDLSQERLQRYFREHCPEYHPTLEACLPISYTALFKILRLERPDLCWDDMQSYHHLKAMITQKNIEGNFSRTEALQSRNLKRSPPRDLFASHFGVTRVYDSRFR